MRKKPSKKIEKFRVKKGRLKSDRTFGNNGVFAIPGPYTILHVVVSDCLGSCFRKCYKQGSKMVGNVFH